jgi:hypothetical protein
MASIFLCRQNQNLLDFTIEIRRVHTHKNQPGRQRILALELPGRDNDFITRKGITSSIYDLHLFKGKKG